MKLKSVLNADSPDELVQRLQSWTWRNTVLKSVLVPYLHVPQDFGPAEFYIQHCDLSQSKFMCVVTLTGVSVTTSRSTDDFKDTVDALVEIYGAILEVYIKKGERCQLMVSIHLDQIPFGRTSPLIERMVWIEGKAD